ncbi:MAG: thiol-disulfide oxidoreductase DCC family protein [Bosea sp. (in: a-proteobacteria)]
MSIPSASPGCTVLYDGACPVCSREIAVYQRLSAGAADAPLFVDVTNAEPVALAGLTKEQALARFHVVTQNGTLVSGAEAFLSLWRATPRFRLLGRALSVPPMPWLLERAYRGFLVVRRLWR